MQDLKDLKRCFHVNARGGQAPALRYARPSPFHRRARACPSPCLDLGKDRSSGSPDPERVKSRRSCPTEWGPRLTVGRGPVPRRASVGTENGLGRRAVFAQVERSRGTDPRATVCRAGSVSPQGEGLSLAKQRPRRIGPPRYSGGPLRIRNNKK